MAPVRPDDPGAHIDDLVSRNKVMIFSKTTCSFCRKTQEFFNQLKVEFGILQLDELVNGSEYQSILRDMTGQTTVPNVFINGNHVGGCSDVLEAHNSGKLMTMIMAKQRSYDYDLIVIGGGSGGIAAAKDAAKLGKKVACCDFVKPSASGTTWGLGGTCVNVGCIPKKFMHHTALLGQSIQDARAFGWEFDEKVHHNWISMKDAIQDYIASLNWGYKVEFREMGVDYYNANAEFIDAHTLKLTTKKNKESQITSETMLLAMGGRPIYPGIPGDKEHAITSDDIFSLPHPPGKTLCVGASYVSLECAGFLKGLGFDVTVMVRSILLRGFDQQMADKVGEYMESEGITFLRQTVPTMIEKVKDGSPGLLKVSAITQTGEAVIGEYNTVLIATGRAPNTSGLGLDIVGVQLNKSGYVIADEGEKTSVDNIYAIGDILEGRMELTPLAIQAGKLLINRLYNNANYLCDYVNVPTTVFTPLEYGCIGYTEEAAIEKFGETNIEVYHKYFLPYEWIIPAHSPNYCYAKLICLLPENEKVIGFHLLGPNAGEITQGYGVAMKAGARKTHFDNTIGIHPTSTEVFTTLSVTKRSGIDVNMKGCGG